MIPKLMVVRKPKHSCSERLDCHERHNSRSTQKTAVGQSRIKNLLN